MSTTGTMLNGRYQLDHVLGSGGMATVWRGQDLVLGRPVAVKLLHPGLAQDSRFAQRFAAEARHAAMLAHPGIVTVFDTGVDAGVGASGGVGGGADAGTPYLVMELVDGRPLSQLLADGVGLPVEQSVTIAAAVLDALAAAHRTGLVHRDVKPANIMVTGTGEVKVVDFGIAHATASDLQLTGTDAVLGTAAYLAPEQATAAPVDGRTDLYAVGCVLYEMLTGRTPFTGGSALEIAAKQVGEYPLPMTALRPGLPPALDAAVMRLLAKDPAQRPADAAQARVELLASIGQAPLPAPAMTVGLASPAPTMAMPPLTPFSQLPVSEPARPAPRRDARDARAGRGGGRGLLVAGAALAAIVVVTGVVLLLDPGAKTPSASAAQTPVASAPAPTNAAAPPPSPTAATQPGSIADLRAQVAASSLGGDDRDQLLSSLDEAAQDMSDGNNGDASHALRDAQKQIRHLAQHGGLDQGTASRWQSSLNRLSASAHSSDNNN